MAGDSTSEWALPVSFYFQVDFQRRGGPMFGASFKEVSGLGWEFNMEKKDNNSGGYVEMPKGLSFSRVELKYPVGDKSEMFQKWIEKCFGIFEENSDSETPSQRKAEMYDMVIKLLDEKGRPLAAWNCYHAYPIRWSLGGLDSESSKLAMESVTMTFNGIKRIK